MADAASTNGQPSLELRPEELHHLRAAQGWLELGNPGEANNELERVAPEFRSHPVVLMLRWEVCAAAKKWDACVDLATTLTRLLPDEARWWVNLGNSLYFGGQTQSAHDCVKPVLNRFPKNPALRYNLACYACQLGRLEEAKGWLENAFALDPDKKLKQAALDDPDLKPLWESLGE